MWQRFTERARRVILLGQEEANKMGSSNVGTEHLLLGLMRENEGVAAQVLQKFFISLKEVREEIEAEVQPGAEINTDGEPKLTPKAKRVLELAADEARRMRHNYIGTEHLLLALLREKDGVAAMVLRKLGLNLEKARNQVMEYLGPKPSAETERAARDLVIEYLGPESPTPMVSEARELDSHFVARTYTEFNVSPATQILLRAALEEAHKRMLTEVYIPHLLLAILQDEKWEALFVGSGLDVEMARAQLEGHLKDDKAS